MSHAGILSARVPTGRPGTLTDMPSAAAPALPIARTVAVHPGCELYGSDRMVLESVLALGHGTDAVLPGSGPLSETLAARGVPCEVVAFPVLRRVELRSPIAALAFLVRFVLAVPRLAWWLRRREARIVYLSTVIAPVWVLSARLAGCRVVCHVHESEPGMPVVAARALLAPLRAAHAVVANSQDTRAWIARAAGPAVARRTELVYNGVAERSTDARAAWGTPAAQHLVVVGRLAERKGQDVAVRALGELRRRGHDVDLTLVGDCYPGYEHVVASLRQLVAEHGLQEHVVFAGFADPLPYVADADVALVPSRVEPFGLVAVEALLEATPTVASRVGGLAEIVTDGWNGRLVEAGDPHALAAAVADLLDDPPGAARMAEVGQREARERFSLDAYAEALRAVVAAP